MKTDLTLGFSKRTKTHYKLFGTAVLVSEPLGMVSEAPEPRGNCTLTVERLFSLQSKVLVT